MQTPQIQPPPRFFHMPKFQAPNYQKPTHLFSGHRQHLQQNQAIEFDGKRLRKAVTRKTVDYNSAVLKYLEARVWQRDYRDRRAVQPDAAYYTEITPPLSMPDNPINAVTTKFVRTSTNKMRCPIFCVAWTPEGRRLVTGASSGEFTLWNGLTFNFETILQAHDSPVRCMVWSHNDVWMVTGDHAGYVKYWQSNMNNVKMFQAHKEPLRGISFCPIDNKFATCSDDGTVRIYDFLKCFEEKILRGHGADVKCVDWHPQKSLIVSGSKDSQQPIKLWDPKSGQSLATIHAHKNTVMEAKWNKNGNWLLTASRDHLLKLFDIRNMSQEMQTFRGHKKEATSLAWHPVHEGLFTSGGSDGSVMFWVVGADKEVGAMEQAHDSCVWSLAWHPLGHILCSGSNDHTSKFWTRNRPGDRMRDKYNLNTLPKGQDDSAEYDDSGTISSIPGMGLEYGLPDHLKPQEAQYEEEVTIIPGLDFTSEETTPEKNQVTKKIPFSKPIPKQFQQQWMESKQPLLLAPPQESMGNNVAEHQQHMNNEQQLMPPGPPPPGMPPDQQNQFAFQGNMVGNPRMPPPNASYPVPDAAKPGPRPSLLGRPLDKNKHMPPGQPNQENYDMSKQDMSYGDMGRNFPHGVQNRNEGESWRTYGESQTGVERHPENSVHQQNRNNDMGRPEFFPDPAFSENEKFPPEHMPARTGHMLPGSHFPPEKDARFQRNDGEPRPHLNANNHFGAPPDEMNFNAHKRPWQEGPGSENHFPPEQQGVDFNPGHQMLGFGPRLPMRHGGNQFYGGRGPRGMYRGRSPYRIVNQRGRGVRSGFGE